MNASGTENDYWEQLFASRAWGLYPSEDLIRFIARTFRGVKDKAEVRVLEIGCGPGPNIWYLVREGYTAAGIDGSPAAIRQAQERLIREGLPHVVPQVDLRVGNFTSLPWGDESFDVVIEVEALYANSLTDIKVSLDEIRRTLKVGGWFFGKMFGDQTTGSDSGETIEPGTMRHPKIGPCAGNEIAHFFRREELTDLFDGFYDLRIDHIHRSDRNEEIQIFEWLVSARK
jgi:SAM-dependent methyltransferase